MTYDAIIIIGAGHNGLVTGIYLAKAGWKVLVLERNPTPGGAVQTAEVTLPSFRHDLFAANLNLFAGSPFYQEFKDDLHKHGLDFAPTAHTFSSVFPNDSYIGVASKGDATLEQIRALSENDAKAWQQLLTDFPKIAEHLLPLLGVPMPSWALAQKLFTGVRAGGWAWLLETGRLLVSSPRAFADTHFENEKVKALVAAWGMHLDFPPDMAGGALFTYLETFANQSFGMVLGKGGADSMINALVSLFESLSGELRLETEVTKINTENNEAHSVTLKNGETLKANKAVIANVVPPVLFDRLLENQTLPEAFRPKVKNYRFGPGTMMIHLALKDLPNWSAGEELKQYAYVHIAPNLSDLTLAYDQAVSGILPERPALVVGQPTAVDPSRAPDGQHILWVQVRVVPSKIKGDAQNEITSQNWDEVKEVYADRLIDLIADYAPNIRENMLAKHVLSPVDLERANPNLVGGCNISGSHHLRQNFVFRPFPGYSRYKTPIKNLYMVGAGTWPGAGVGAGSGRLLGKMLAK